MIRLARVSSEITRLPQIVRNLLTHLDASQKPVFKGPRIEVVHQLAPVEDIVALGRVVVSTDNRLASVIANASRKNVLIKLVINRVACLVAKLDPVLEPV